MRESHKTVSRPGKVTVGNVVVGMMAMAVVVAGCAGQDATANGPGTSDTSSTTPQTSSSPQESESAGIPPGLLLPNEGEPASDVDTTAWETDNTADRA